MPEHQAISTPRLRKAVENCLKWNQCINGASILSPWFPHDLKAKGYTDQEIQDAGHLSRKIHKVYDHRGHMAVQPMANYHSNN